MIPHSDIEAALGVRTLVSDAMQQALQYWYDIAVVGVAPNRDDDTKTLGWPAMISAELARLTTLEMQVRIEGSPRADWISQRFQRAMTPRQRRKFSLALALGSGIWKPCQSGDDVSVEYIPAIGYYPIAMNADDRLTEAVFIDQFTDSDNVYTRLEWMHVLHGPEDYHDRERDFLEDHDLEFATVYPCVQIINLAFTSSSTDSIGMETKLDARPEWEGIEPIAFLPGLATLPVGYFVTPIENRVDITSELGEAIFAPAIPVIIDADEQYTRLDWEYEGGELAIDTDSQYLKPTQVPEMLDDEFCLRRYGVPRKALVNEAPKHKERMFRGLNLNTGIANSTPFYSVFSPALRDSSYLQGFNHYIRQIESHAGLSFGTFSQVATVERTATEIINSKQKSHALVRDLQASLESALRELIDALNAWGDMLPNAPRAGTVNVSFDWDDSILLDKATERAQWQAEVTMGLRSKAEYRQHFFGEDEATAATAVQAAKAESQTGAGPVLEGVLE